jgi:hypothetical protein
LTEISNFVRNALRGTPPATHPDADLLNAFVEGGLLQRERTGLMEHLATCSACREVITLAQPEIPVLAVQFKPSRSFFASPVLRWGTLAACAVAVASVAVLYRAQTPHEFVGGTVASRDQVTVADATAAPKTKNEIATAPETALKLGEQRSDKDARSFGDQPRKIPAAKVVVGGLASAPSALSKKAEESRREGKFSDAKPGDEAETRAQEKSDTFASATRELAKEQAGLRAPAAASLPATSGYVAAPPARPEAAPAAAEAAAAPTDAVQANRKKLERAEATTPSAGSLVGLQSGRVENSMAPPTNLDTSFRLAHQGARLRWRLTNPGALERSPDGGRSWQSVAVENQNSWRVLAALGSHVWVGGAAGALFHSADAGTTWKAVRVANGSRALTGDLVGLRFSDETHGVLQTSTQETWTTADGGASWQGQ